MITKKINVSVIVLLTVVLIASVCLTLTACGICNSKIEPNQYPNVAAEKANVATNQEVANVFSENITKEFMKLTDMFKAANSYENSAIAVFLERLNQLGSNVPKYAEIESSLIIDLPATSGMENVPGILLCGNLGNFYFENPQIKGSVSSQLDYNFSSDDGTIRSTGSSSINANGGMAAATALALITTPNVSHGPIRILLCEKFLTYIKSTALQSMLKGYSFAIDLTSVNHVGNIATSFPNTQSAEKNYFIKKENASSEKEIFSIKTANLTIDTINYAQLNKHASSFELLQYLIRQMTQQGIDFRLVDVNINNTYSDLTTEVIPTLMDLSILINPSDTEKVKTIVKDTTDYFRKNYDEKEFSLEATSSSVVSNCLTQDSQNAIVDAILNGAHYGITTQNKDEINNSLNIFDVKTSTDNITFNVCRNYFDAYSKAYGKNNPDFLNSAEHYLMDGAQYYSSTNITIRPTYLRNGLGFESPKNASLTNIAQDSFSKTCGITPAITRQNSFSILGQIQMLSPGMTAIGLGPDIEHPGISGETVFTKSLPVYSASLFYIFENVNGINQDSITDSNLLWSQAKQAYYNYLSNSSFPLTLCKFIYIDNDNIPELFCEGDCEASGNLILSYRDGKIEEMLTHRLGCEYIDKEGLILNSDGNMDYYYNIVSQLNQGGFSVVGDGSYTTDWRANPPTATYYWNSQTVNRDEYLDKLNSAYDKTKSQYPMQNSLYSGYTNHVDVFTKKDVLEFLRS